MVRSYKLSYFDCTKPKTISRINQKTACATTDQSKGLSQTYKLLQRRREDTVGGFRCKMEVSDFLLYCGSFSHQKLIQVPSVDVYESISGEHCREMVTTQKFSPPGTNHVERLELGSQTVIKVSPLGVIKYDSNVYCEGQSAKIGNEVVSQVLDLKQYKITLTPETFVVRQGGVEALTTHSRLPKSCISSALSCETGEGTYVWDPVLDKCEMSHVQDVQLTRENELHVDHEHKLVFEIEGEIQTPIGCPKGTVYLTKYKDLYLTKTSGYSRLNSRDVDLTLYSDTRMEYLEYNLEKGAQVAKDSVKRQMCENRYSKEGRITQLKNETFSVRSGDVFLIFQCSKKTSRIAVPEGSGCWDKVPMEDGMYVDIDSRIGYKHASPRDCSVHFPMWIETEGEGWVTVSDTIRPVDPPESRYLSHEEIDHESFASSKGLYTAEEIAAWESIASWGSFHDSVMSRISTGVCQTENGPCSGKMSASVTGYSLDKLSSITDKLSPLTKWVTKNLKSGSSGDLWGPGVLFPGDHGNNVLNGWSGSRLEHFVHIPMSRCSSDDESSNQGVTGLERGW